MPEYIKYPKPSDFKPEPTFTEGEKIGRPRCQGWARQAGRQCRHYPNVGKRVCRNHGGETPGGIASANWVNGRTSKYLPKRLHETYLASMQDRDLLALRNEISVVDARIDDLWQRVDTGESGQLWLDSKKTLLNLRKALATQNTEKVGESIIELDDLIMRGSSDYAAYAEIYDAIELRRRLVETERKRLVDMQSMISAEQATAFMRALTLSVRENISDPIILARIQAAFIRISNNPGD